MSLRVLFFAGCLAAGAFAGWLLHPGLGLALGTAAGAMVWFVVETLQAVRVLRWLKLGGLRGAPYLGGWWGEAATRARRALVTREDRADDAERRLEAFLAAIRTSPNGVVLLDPQGRIEWINETAASHFGFDPLRDLQQHVVNLLREPEFNAFYQAGRYSDDVVVPAPGSTAGRPRKLSLHLHPYGEGRLLLLSRDVTVIEQAETMRRDFVANVSHEIRTPLTVLAGFVETLQNLDLPAEERSRYLGTMATQAQRMQALVNDLLTLSRLEGSPSPGSAEWTPVATFLAQCRHEAQALSSALRKPLDLRIAEASGVIIGGAPGELQSAISNLVGNAVRYTPAGGKVEVQVDEMPDGRVEVSVRDTGAGIAPEHLPRLTERFYRVDRSRSRDSGGTGLGLAIVKHVVQRHGGELKIASTPGAGSLFTIILPASRVRRRVSGPAGSAAQPARESAAG